MCLDLVFRTLAVIVVLDYLKKELIMTPPPPPLSFPPLTTPVAARYENKLNGYGSLVQHVGVGRDPTHERRDGRKRKWTCRHPLTDRRAVAMLSAPEFKHTSLDKPAGCPSIIVL